MKTHLWKTIYSSLLLVAYMGSASATVWEPTDGDANTRDFSTAAGNLFGIFDVGNIPQFGGVADLALFTSNPDTDKVTFTLLGDSTWEIENLAGATFNLGSTFEFVVAFFDGLDWISETSSVEIGAGSNVWELDWAPGNAGVLLEITDVRPIPIPAAAWLFGSALMGLVVVARRRLGSLKNGLITRGAEWTPKEASPLTA